MENKLPFENIEREILVRKEAETSDKFGHNPDKRPIEEHIKHGIVNLDKPAGPTSHQVSAYAQKILGLKKAGHSGTLDPGVTGVLPVALEKATKIVQLLLLAGKEYIALMHLHKEVDDYRLYKTIDKFTGKIEQLPPIKSSVKRRFRKRSVYYIEVLSAKGQDVLLRIGCEAGTYIRKLLHDMGQDLGCGAHMQELRRSKVASFTEDDNNVTLQDLTDAYHYWKEDGHEDELRRCIFPVERGAQHVPKIWVFDTTVNTLCHGANLAVPGISKLEDGIEEDDQVAVMTLKGELVSYGISKMNSKDLQNKRKGLAVKTEKVFLEPGIYPKIER